MVNQSTSLNDNSIKFLYSYGGKILPRPTDGKLRYVGGSTRVLAVDRSISFAELLVKLGELCGFDSVTLRCQFPNEDLDALISIKSDEDLVNLIEEYDQASKAFSKSLKIKAFLSPPSKSPKKVSPPSSICSSTAGGFNGLNNVSFRTGRYVHQMSKSLVYPVYGTNVRHHAHAPLPPRYPTHIHLGNHCQ